MKTLNRQLVARKAPQHKEIRLVEFKAAFRDIARKYYPHDPKHPDPLHPDNEACQEALFRVLREFTKSAVLAQTGPYTGAGNLVVTAYLLEPGPYSWIRPRWDGAVRAYGEWRPWLREIARPLIENENGRKELTEFIINLLKNWPMVPAGVYVDEATPDWAIRFCNQQLQMRPQLLGDEALAGRILSVLVLDDDLRSWLARLAHDVRRCDGFRRKKGWKHLLRALEEGLERITTLSLRQELAGLVSDTWELWPENRKDQALFAQQYTSDSSLKLTSGSDNPFTLVYNAKRDARAKLRRYLRRSLQRRRLGEKIAKQPAKSAV